MRCADERPQKYQHTSILIVNPPNKKPQQQGEHKDTTAISDVNWIENYFGISKTGTGNWDWQLSLDVKTAFCGDTICSAFQHFLNTRQPNLMNWVCVCGVCDGRGGGQNLLRLLAQCQHAHILPQSKIHLLFLFPLNFPCGVLCMA